MSTSGKTPLFYWLFEGSKCAKGFPIENQANVPLCKDLPRSLPKSGRNYRVEYRILPSSLQPLRKLHAAISLHELLLFAYHSICQISNQHRLCPFWSNKY